MNRSVLLLFVTAGAAIAAPAAAQDRSNRAGDRNEESPNWHLYATTGVGYSQRDDDDATTDYFRIPMSLRLTRGPLRFSVSMPYLFLNGPASVSGDDDDAVQDPRDGNKKRSGIGDLSLTGRFRLPEDSLAGFELDLMGRVKLPTASRRKGLGTGEVDYALGAEVSRKFGKFEPFVSAQYRINGDPPDRNYRDTVAASIGTSVRLSGRTRASIAYDYSQSRVRGRSASQMLDAGLSMPLAKGLRLSGDAAIGLSKNAPDFRVGASLTARVF